MTATTAYPIRKFIQRIQALPSHTNKGIRYVAIAIEAFILTSVSLFIVSAMGTAEAGFFGLFLAAASLSSRFQALLQENKDLIFVDKVDSKSANALTALSILMMFIGICFSYLIIAMMFTTHDLKTFFGFIFESTNSETGTLLTRDFSLFIPIIQHNLIVMGTIAALCLLYRSYGALLTLGWNASVWVIVIYGLTLRLLGDDTGQNIAIGVWAFAAIAPHLILEGASYVLIALAAIFYSKGITKYLIPLPTRQPGSTASILAMELPKDSVFYDITIACMKMVLAALLILLFAAAVEAFYAPWMLKQLSHWLGR